MKKIKLHESEGYAEFNKKRQGIFITHKEGIYKDIPYHKVRLTQVFKPIQLIKMKKKTLSNCHSAELKKKSGVSYCQKCGQPCTPVKGKECPFCGRFLSNDTKLDNLGTCPKCGANLLEEESKAISMTLQRPYRFISFDIEMISEVVNLLKQVYKDAFDKELFEGELVTPKPVEKKSEEDEVEALYAELDGMRRRK